MKIAVVTQNFPVREQPYRGHSAYQTLLRLDELAELRVFAPQLEYPKFLRPRHRPWAQTDLAHRDPNLNATFFSCPALPVVSRPFNGSVCARRLEPLLRADPPDVIVNYWVYPDGYAAVEVGRKLGIPVIVKAIGSDVNSTAGISRWLTLAPSCVPIGCSRSARISPTRWCRWECPLRKSRLRATAATPNCSVTATLGPCDANSASIPAAATSLMSAATTCSKGCANSLQPSRPSTPPCRKSSSC